MSILIRMKQYGLFEAKGMALMFGLFKKSRFKVTAVVGALLLVVGVSLLGYSVFAIQEHEQMLNSDDLSLEEMWNHEGALQWWRNTYATLFFPLTAVFMALGGVILVSQPLLTKLNHKTTLEPFTDNVRRATDEKFERPKID